MRNNILICLGLTTFLWAGCGKSPAPVKPEVAELTGDQLVKKGEYLVTIMGCNDCHSPKKMGPNGPEVIPELMLSGYPADRKLPEMDKKSIKNGWVLLNEDMTAFAGPWGISYAANLTSDPTGIGNWPEENFRRALKEGKFKGLPGTRTLLPPMPWFNYVNMSDEDIKAMFAYLKSTNPVRNVVPAPVPPEGPGM